MVSTELFDVLFWDRIDEFVQFYKKLKEKYLPDKPEEYSKKLNSYIVDEIKSKSNFIKIIDDYSASGKAIWQGREAQYCDTLGADDVMRALKFGSIENGRRRHLRYREMAEKWAYHLDD